MNKRNLFIPALLIVAAVLFSALAFAAQEITIFNAVSAASGSYVGFQGAAAERTAGYTTLRLQVCGTGFTGTVTASQGAKSTTLSTVKVLTLSGVTGCAAANYIKLPSAAQTGFSYTRSAGYVTVYLEESP